MQFFGENTFFIIQFWAKTYTLLYSFGQKHTLFYTVVGKNLPFIMQFLANTYPLLYKFGENTPLIYYAVLGPIMQFFAWGSPKNEQNICDRIKTLNAHFFAQYQHLHV